MLCEKGLSWWQWRVDRTIKPLSTSSVWSGGCVAQSHSSVCLGIWNKLTESQPSDSQFCSWKNTNKEILVIAPGSIVKINTCFLLVSCFYLLFSKTCHCSMFSCEVQTRSWHLQLMPRRICSHAQQRVGISALKQNLLTHMLSASLLNWTQCTCTQFKTCLSPLLVLALGQQLSHTWKAPKTCRLLCASPFFTFLGVLYSS